MIQTTLELSIRMILINTDFPAERGIIAYRKWLDRVLCSEIYEIHNHPYLKWKISETLDTDTFVEICHVPAYLQSANLSENTRHNNKWNWLSMRCFCCLEFDFKQSSVDYSGDQYGRWHVKWQTWFMFIKTWFLDFVIQFHHKFFQ